MQVLTGLSRGFFQAPPAAFADAPVMTQRPVVTIAPADQVDALHAMMERGIGLKELALAELRAMIPALRPGYVVEAAIESDAFDMDVAALHQGFLRMLRGAGGILALRSRTSEIRRHNGSWHVEVSGGGRFTAPVLVDAAGAWGDVVAKQAGVAPLGLVPKRRTGAVINPAPYVPDRWPMLMDAAGTWYCRAEARTRLMVSPADETPMDPHDVQPDELDVAIAIDRMQQALQIEVTRVEHSWAGLRTFTPDHSLAFGYDGSAPGFFWAVGQGGYGIQTSPAAGRLIADLVSGRDPGDAGAVVKQVDPRRFDA